MVATDMDIDMDGQEQQNGPTEVGMSPQQAEVEAYW